jgi:hypothetical protein
LTITLERADDQAAVDDEQKAEIRAGQRVHGRERNADGTERGVCVRKRDAQPLTRTEGVEILGQLAQVDRDARHEHEQQHESQHAGRHLTGRAELLEEV